MPKKHSKGQYHPNRVSGEQKRIRQREYEVLHKKKAPAPIQPIDLKRNDWSL